MASLHKLFIQLLLDFDQQRKEMQEGLRQAQSTMSQSRQIGEDARRIHAEVLETVF